MKKQGVPHSVRRMVEDSFASTAPLAEFLVAYLDDDHLWWELPCGHHQNLFDQAVQLCVDLRIRLAEYEDVDSLGVDR